ncbi:MAG: SGNH/GDSL hydrolase family protein [Paucibacter sp.]|nr:SGNH/GDSL hydrolase family protein [Roseateles sp.]
MPKTIKYTGTQIRWPELSVTGKQSIWNPGQQEERADAEAALLLGTGKFEAVATVAITATPDQAAAFPGLVSGAGIGRGLRTVILGDSLAAYNSAGVGISTIVLAAGVITVVTASAHQMRDGQKANVSGTSNATFHARNFPITYISSTSFSYPAPAGATGVATGGGVLCQNQLSSCGDFVHTNARLGSRMRFVANLGIGGERADQIRARLDEAFALSPDVLWFNAGTNDVIQDRDYALTIADIEYCAAEAVRRNILFVIKTLPPFASGGAYYTAARNANLLNLNTWHRNLATRYRNVYVLDLYRALIQPTDASGFGATAYFQAADSVHYNPRGAARAGALGAALLADVLPAIDNRATSITDNYGSNAANRDLHDRAPWTATGGTVSAPATGVAPTGWICEASAGWTTPPAYSCPARADGLGYNISATGTPGAANNTLTIRTDSTAQNARLPSFVGKKYRWICEVTVTNAVAAGLRTLEVYAAAAVGAASGQIATALSGLSQAGLLALDSDTATTLTFPTAEFEIPSGAVTNCSFTVRGTMDAASASAITIAAGSVRMQPMDDQ